MGKRYQYRIEAWDDLSESDMNGHGSEGYKLVAVVPATGMFSMHLVFERELPPVSAEDLADEVVEEVIAQVERGANIYNVWRNTFIGGKQDDDLTDRRANDPSDVG